MTETQLPNSLEETVASALLLLSETIPPSLSLSSPKSDSDQDELVVERSKRKICRDSFESSGSKSSSSSLTNDDDSSEEINARRINFITSVARNREMKFKVVRKSRSKVEWISEGQKVTSGKTLKGSPGSDSTEASCLSRNSSSLSSARSLRCVTRAEKKLPMVHEENRTKRVVGSAHIRRRAEAILKLLSSGCSSEVRIRQLLGDSPDTSKALRMLLKLEEVKRTGTGGRHDPYVYTIAAESYYN
ncbi:Glycerol kinase [Quillaja saponaria]|uniref:Glycerol kinase n=1 Tax=Quillaja saponaria TaxID=32244 RepID=A0AAD7VDW1_QUISA|nr:Glycerol kinase [Quillaja saponaria]